MPEDLANEAQPKESADTIPSLPSTSGLPAWHTAMANMKAPLVCELLVFFCALPPFSRVWHLQLDALAPSLDTPGGGLAWLEGCLTTPKPASPSKQAVQLPIPPLRDAPPAALQAP
jgi:hypothetical protein